GTPGKVELASGGVEASGLGSNGPSALHRHPRVRPTPLHCRPLAPDPLHLPVTAGARRTGRVPETPRGVEETTLAPGVGKDQAGGRVRPVGPGDRSEVGPPPHALADLSEAAPRSGFPASPPDHVAGFAAPR